MNVIKPDGRVCSACCFSVIKRIRTCFLFLIPLSGVPHHTKLFFLNLLIELFQPEFMNFEITDTGYRFRIFFS